MMKAIVTKYHGPTDYKGSRISATDSDGNRVMVSYDDASRNPHLDAAVALVRKMGWAPVQLAEGSLKDGYVYVVVDAGGLYAIQDAEHAA